MSVQRRGMRAIALAVALLAGLAPARAAAQGVTDARGDDRYQAGQDLIENGRWAQAADRFREVVAAGQTRVDAAMYWLAYAQFKQAQHADALATLRELSGAFPTSRWLTDARALELEARRSAGQPVRPENEPDEELKLLALQGLQQSDPAGAIPLLRAVLEGTQPLKLKERALFVLAQSDAPEAHALITGIAKGEGHPDLQRKAIQYLGITSRGRNAQVLADIYTASADVDVKRQILRAYMVSGDRVRVLAAATGEASPELRQEAVRQLGVMGARDELWQLYQKESSVDVKRQIIQALFVGGDAARLIALANTEAQADLRRTAVRHLGTMGAARTGAALTALYDREQDPAIRRQVVQALYIQGNAEALVAMARKETNHEARKDLIQKLSTMKSKVALDYLLEVLGK